MDLATALDLSLEDQQEAKFLALRTLHGKKIKQLMLSIETKEKEVAKLKLLSKDSRRTQMIQALRNKIKDMELTMDVMKEEIGKVRESPKSKEEVNDFVIRKTVGGPKRFRPLTREEMENKILELEKKLSKGGKGGGSVSGGPSISSQARSIAGARDALTSIAGRQGIRMSEVPESGANTNNNKGSGGEGEGGGGLSKIAQLMEEINGLRSALDVSEGNCELQKEEVSRLRKRNSDLAAEAEEVSFYKTQYLEMEASKDDVMEEVLMVQRRLAELTEENNVLETNSSTELELAQAELDTLQSQCEKLLNQNASLLKKLGDLEEELDDAHHQAGMASVATKQAGSASAQSALVTAETERKLTRLQDKLKQSEQLIASLQQDNQQITLLKSQLREKNNVIKKQSQQLGELRTSRDNSRSPVRILLYYCSPSFFLCLWCLCLSLIRLL
jgi:chromosome segregation ATPase